MRKSSIRTRLVLLAAMLAIGTIVTAPALAQTEPKTEPQAEQKTGSQPEQKEEQKAGQQTEPKADPGEASDVIRGTITDISGAVVLVEEDPSDDAVPPSGSPKGYFTVTGATEISRLVGGDALAPASFGDLREGQLVEAAYAGDVAESYPSQGNAGNITILEGFPDGGEPQPGEVSATGAIGQLADFPGATHGITDEATDTFYGLRSDKVDLDAYAGDGQRVNVRGVPVSGPGGPNRLLNVTEVVPADGGSNDEDKATLLFELTVEGEPPEETRFFGFVPAEGGFSAPLSDPDGDGTYNGSITVDKYPPGPRPVPPGVEPVSLPVQIVQGTGTTGPGGGRPGEPIRLIKDFEQVKIDGDKTFEANVSFDGSQEPRPGDEVEATGVLRELDVLCNECARHGIIDEASGINYGLISDQVDLSSYAGERVTVYGTLQAVGENVLRVTSVEPAGGDSGNDGSGNGGSGGGGSYGGGSGGGSGGSSSGSGGGLIGGVAKGVRGLLPSTGGLPLAVLGAGALLVAGGLVARRIIK